MTSREINRKDYEKLSEWASEYEKVKEREAKRPLLVKVFYSEEYRMLAIKNILFAVMWLFIGGAFALFLRSQAGLTSSGIPVVVAPQYYFQSMTNHVMDMIFGSVFSTVFAVSFYMIPALNGSRLVKWPKIANAGLWIAVLGLFMMNLGGVKNQYLFTFLNPLQASPTWYIGYAIMVVGEWMEMISVLGTSFLGRIPGRLIPTSVGFIVMDMIMMALANISVFLDTMWSLMSPIGGLGINIFGVPNAEIWKGLFWFADHPLVYFAPYTLTGAIIAIAPLYAKRPVYSVRFTRWLIPVLFVLGASVYVHHLVDDPWPLILRDIFAQTSTALIGIPFAALWMLFFITLGDPRKLKWDAGLAFIFAAAVWNIIGGIQAEPTQPTPSVDPTVHNTLWLPSHFHIMLALYSVGGLLGVLYVVGPELWGRKWYSEKLGWIHFWGWQGGMGLLVTAFAIAGFYGAIRREVAWPAFYEVYYQMAMIGGWLAGFATIVFAYNLILTLLYGEKIKETDLPMWAVQVIALERYGMRREGYNEDEMPLALPADGMIRQVVQTEGSSGGTTRVGIVEGSNGSVKSLRAEPKVDANNEGLKGTSWKPDKV
ncbi:cbb3-type cytochrome c oxidase subunit I [Sulfuracidifex metallicus]|uniref:Cytochrome-c oxidase n=2 Tax=Sulfuracidifex metallicus TaxID=47303 RepID=A0A6A9QI42_SULME|nr:cbb3-type cytochrome c oxidase subunit I [Sulfuracidifex metallicus]ABG91823.1 FoxA [Sulfuracidifex metallicus DSM 6482 = JCM 9184]MUN27900.1 cytochrome-c oxidase [Sulfuracidifex metallicus DSM 6482 = JCM 9184]